MKPEAERAVCPADLTELVTAVMVRSGASLDDAMATATVLVWADQSGRGPQGTVWLETLAARLSDGSIVSPVPLDLVEDKPALVTLDAHNGLGHRAGIEAVEMAAERANQYGIAAVAIRNSSHFGACGYYASILSSRGFLGVVATNAYPKVAPHGGSSPVLGTNPIGFGLPAEGLPDIVGDLSTGAVAGSKVRHAIRFGEDLDEGAALDAQGRPSRDPRVLSDGGVMLPIAGAKGMALGILVEALTSILSNGTSPDLLGSMFDGAQPAGTSHFVMAIAMPKEAGASATGVASAIKASAPREGMSIRMPGEAISHRGSTTQIDLDADTLSSLRRACEALEVQVPDFVI